VWSYWWGGACGEQKLADTSPQLHNLGYRDRAWSVNKLAAVARKQGLAQVCVRIPNALYGYLTMELQEAFVKIREQVKAYPGAGEGQAHDGSQLNQCDPPGLLPRADATGDLPAQGRVPAAARGQRERQPGVLDSCLQLPQPGQDLEVLGPLLRPGLAGEPGGGRVARLTPAAATSRLSSAGPPTAAPSWPACSTSSASRTGRASWGAAFDRHIDNVPYWVWLAWIPQLLLSLQRPEQAYTKAILFKVAAMYPQALYYWFENAPAGEEGHCAPCRGCAAGRQPHAAAAGLRGGGGGAGAGQGQGQQAQNSSASAASNDAPMGGPGVANGVHNPKGPGQPGQPGAPAGAPGAPQGASRGRGSSRGRGRGRGRGGADGNAASSLASGAMSAFDAAKEVMETLRVKHPNLAAELEGMLTEIGARFVPLPEERLLAVVHALLQRCYKYPTATTAEVPMSLKRSCRGCAARASPRTR